MNKDADKSNGIHTDENTEDEKFAKNQASRTIAPLRDPSRAHILHRLTSEWDGLSKDLSGEELLKKQKEFALQSVGELGAGPELLDFLDYLRERGAGDVREWVLNEGIAGLFSGAGAAEARSWLLTVEDEALRRRFLRQAGEEWAGAGFLGYMDQWDHFHGGQAELLTGYCATLAKSDPMAAFKAFKEIGSIKNINYETLDQVIMQSTPTADFLKMATFFGEDNKTLAKTSRRAVLTKWAETNPKEAGHYVIGNTQTVHADQMEVVAAGGPLPLVLAYDGCRWGTGAGPDKDLYFHGAAVRGARPLLEARTARVRGAGAKKVGLCVIATANYRMFLRPLLRSVRANFLPAHEVTVFLFTDGEVEEAEDLRVIRVEHSEWPGMAIRRYALFREHAGEFGEIWWGRSVPGFMTSQGRSSLMSVGVSPGRGLRLRTGFRISVGRFRVGGMSATCRRHVKWQGGSMRMR